MAERPHLHDRHPRSKTALIRANFEKLCNEAKPAAAEAPTKLWHLRRTSTASSSGTATSASTSSSEASLVSRPTIMTPRTLSPEESPARQLKDLTVLLLGETGTGKSTCVNAIANYVLHETMFDALKTDLVSYIPTSFLLTDSDGKEHTVRVGFSENECTQSAQSGTQKPIEYVFTTDQYKVTLIDTPGIGDVRGIEKDKQNMQSVLNAIASHDYINAICILMKSNESRLTTTFEFCLHELLLRLHRNAISNICFFFTNARGTFFRPGEVMDIMGRFLQKVNDESGVQVPLEKTNCFCIDNEAYRLVCAANQGVSFSTAEKATFAESWDVSKTEIYRFLAHAASRPAHEAGLTVHLNKIRDIVASIAHPMADMAVEIETNRELRKRHLNELTKSKVDLTILRGKATILQIRYVAKPLSDPQIVCTAAGCVRLRKIEHTSNYDTIYKVCHERCKEVSGATQGSFPEPRIRDCDIMSHGGTCKKCSCDWSKHMLIMYSQSRKRFMVENPRLKTALETGEDLVKVKEKMISEMSQEVNELQREREIIQRNGLYFAQFLRDSSIVLYNYAFEEHMKRVIEEQRRYAELGEELRIVRKLEKILASHKEEREIMEQAARSTVPLEQTYDFAVIEQKLKELFDLKHCGGGFRQLLNALSQGEKAGTKIVVAIKSKWDWHSATFEEMLSQ